MEPADGVTSVPQVDPLVRSIGAEVGSRFTWNEKLNTSVALWYLELDSELLFVGDAGTTEASRSSRRYGLEIANYYTPVKGLSFELDAAFTDAKFDDNDPDGDDIPGALDTVVSAAVTGQLESGWLASMRLRHFGPRPLIEDGSVESDSTTVVNLRAGYQRETWAIFLDVLNLFDSDDDDITSSIVSAEDMEPNNRCLRLDYIKKPGSFSGWVTVLVVGDQFVDISKYSHICFKVRGARGGELFTVGLADQKWYEKQDLVQSPQIESYLSNGVTTEWQEVEVPLSHFSNLKFEKIAMIGIHFNCRPEMEGTVYIGSSLRHFAQPIGQDQDHCCAYSHAQACDRICGKSYQRTRDSHSAANQGK